MPGGPDYPLDTSQRFTLAKRNDIKTPMARTEVQGIIHAPSGDINNWVTAQSVAEVRRQMVTALAYLDVADLVQDKISTAVARVADAVGRLDSAVASQSHLLQQVAGFLGVFVPAWLTLKEVQEGDEMGISRPSANELGLKPRSSPCGTSPDSAMKTSSQSIRLPERLSPGERSCASV